MAGLALRAETPEEWVKLGARVHGGFGAFIPVGIRIGGDAMKRLRAQPRELSVVYYGGEGVPCPCSVDGVMLAVGASPGQGSVRVEAEKSPSGTFAVVVIRPRKGGDGLKYTVPMSHTTKLGEIIQDPLARYDAVMGIGDLFVVEPIAVTRSDRQAITFALTSRGRRTCRSIPPTGPMIRIDTS
jgi:FmdE, Molybdenum formylmethanofuran dehydrogenase operon